LNTHQPSAWKSATAARECNPTGNTGGTGDSNFNQALGINDAGTIVGYAGDGTVVPNKGNTVVSPFAPANLTSENAPGSVCAPFDFFVTLGGFVAQTRNIQAQINRKEGSDV
jgi:hypothetical protein